MPHDVCCRALTGRTAGSDLTGISDLTVDSDLPLWYRPWWNLCHLCCAQKKARHVLVHHRQVRIRFFFLGSFFLLDQRLPTGTATATTTTMAQKDSRVVVRVGKLAETRCDAEDARARTQDENYCPGIFDRYDGIFARYDGIFARSDGIFDRNDELFDRRTSAKRKHGAAGKRGQREPRTRDRQTHDGQTHDGQTRDGQTGKKHTKQRGLCGGEKKRQKAAKQKGFCVRACDVFSVRLRHSGLLAALHDVQRRHVRQGFVAKSARRNRKARRVRGVDCPAVRMLLWVQKYKCFYCGHTLPPNWSVDHLDPVCDGGADSQNNCVIACETCHSRKTRHDDDTRRRME